MNLGYCVVHYVHEQGSPGRVCVVTSRNLEAAQGLIETLSGYYRDHARYKQDIYDLTDMYHRNAIGLLDSKRLESLKQYSPEAYNCIVSMEQVDYTVQVFEPLGMRHWINRRFDGVSNFVREENHKAAEDYKRKRAEAKVLKNSVAL